jgi:hypothetical protein
MATAAIANACVNVKSNTFTHVTGTRVYRVLMYIYYMYKYNYNTYGIIHPY